MSPGFLEPIPFFAPDKAHGYDGQNWLLAPRMPLVYVRPDGTILVMVPGAATDGPSIPDAVRNILKPYGKLWLCGVIHDGIYRSCVVRLVNGVLEVVLYNQADGDALIYEAMRLHGVPAAEELVVYGALRMFGSFAWSGDLAATIPHIDTKDLLNILQVQFGLSVAA